jgi:multidrug efflux pump subunit AcrA (membrane-fusion protein)
MDLPDIGRYRRRFIVEFGPEDSGLIDRLGVAHRTKRAAIIAGLRLLDSGETEQLRAQVGTLAAELETARTAVEERAKAARDSKPSAEQAKADLREKREELAAARAEVRRVKAANAEVRRSNAELTAERDRLRDLVPHYAYCGYCDKLVPECEWAEQPGQDGFLVYHEPDGYRAKGSIVGRGASLLFWREKSLLAPRDGESQ